MKANKVSRFNKKMSAKTAKALFSLNTTSNRGKTEMSNLVGDVCKTSNLRMFIDKLTLVLDKSPENAEVFKEVVEQILKMPIDNFPLFVTLILLIGSNLYV